MNYALVICAFGHSRTVSLNALSELKESGKTLRYIGRSQGLRNPESAEKVVGDMSIK